MKTLIAIISALVISSPALAAKPGTEPPAPEATVGITVANTGKFNNLVETNALCETEFPNSAVATTAEFIKALGNGLTVINDINAITVVMRATGIVIDGAGDAIDVQSQTRMYNGMVFFQQTGVFTDSRSGFVRVACIY